MDTACSIGIKHRLRCPNFATKRGERTYETSRDFPSQRAGGCRRGSRRRSILDARHGRCAAGGTGHAGADRGGQEGRPGHLLHLDRPAGRGEAGQGVRGEISGHCGPRRAHRRGARVPAHRPGIFQQHPRRRCREFIGCRPFHRLETRRHSGALRAGGGREVLSGRAQGYRRPVRELPRLAQHHRLQHQSGEGRRRAEEFCRSARSQMEGQDRQGASRLQRHHHDRDLSDAARSRLELLRSSSPSRTSCRCSRRPIRRRSSISASAR